MKLISNFTKLVSSIAVGGALFIAAPLAIGPVSAQELESSIARGGRLYDKWFKVIKAPKPEDNHAAWPASNTKKKGNATHRCKSCHGWDLMGKDGAYASGSYLTGIGGVTGYAGGSADAVIAIMKNDLHGYAGKMDEQDYVDLANFVTMGQFDIDTYINRETKAANGDAAKGAAYYNTLCANCHGLEGREPKDMGITLGGLTHKNPWEVIQKIMNGQPAEDMPALRAFGPQVATDIMAYMQTLPSE